MNDMDVDDPTEEDKHEEHWNTKSSTTSKSSSSAIVLDDNDQDEEDALERRHLSMRNARKDHLKKTKDVHVPIQVREDEYAEFVAPVDQAPVSLAAATKAIEAGQQLVEQENKDVDAAHQEIDRQLANPRVHEVLNHELPAYFKDRLKQAENILKEKGSHLAPEDIEKLTQNFHKTMNLYARQAEYIEDAMAEQNARQKFKWFHHERVLRMLLACDSGWIFAKSSYFPSSIFKYLGEEAEAILFKELASDIPLMHYQQRVHLCRLAKQETVFNLGVINDLKYDPETEELPFNDRGLDLHINVMRPCQETFWTCNRDNYQNLFKSYTDQLASYQQWKATLPPRNPAVSPWTVPLLLTGSGSNAWYEHAVEKRRKQMERVVMNPAEAKEHVWFLPQKP